LSQPFEPQFKFVPAGFRNQRIIRPLALAPGQQLALPPFARPSASSISATGHLSTFVVCDQPLFSWNSRLRRASESTLRSTLIRRNCGSQSTVSGNEPLTKLTTLKLRLERFRTSHARVGVNLLFWQTGAREMRTDFVSFLFKSGTCCGDKWKRSGSPALCTDDGAGFELKSHTVQCIG